VAPVAQAVADIGDANTPGSYVDVVAVAADGSRVAIGERTGRIRVWSPPRAAEPQVFGAPRQGVMDLAFAPGAALLASLGRYGNGTLRFWEPDRAGGEGWVDAGTLPLGRCLALRFDGAGARLAVLCEQEVIVVDVAEQREVARLPSAHSGALTAFDLSASGTTVLTAGAEGDVVVWDVATASPTYRVSVKASRRPGPVPRGVETPTAHGVAAALWGDGSRGAVATIEGTVYAWDLARRVELLSDADPEAAGPPSGSLRFVSPEALLAATGDRRGLRVIDLARKRSRLVVPGAKAYHAVSIGDDGTTAALLTSTLGDRALVYAVQVWRLGLPGPDGAPRGWSLR
jgi:WD40 repeat protein